MSLALTLVLSVAGVSIAAVLLAPVVARRRHQRLRALPFPPEWDRRLRRSVAVYGRLPAELRRRLQGCIRVFLAEKRFVGCGGLRVSEDMRLAIAAQACLLVANRGEDCFPWLRAVLVYPGAFLARHEYCDEAGVHTLEAKELSGESWDEGKVVLAWEEVRHGAADAADGDNVVYHEFAHQLDQWMGAGRGRPSKCGAGLQADPFARELRALRARLAEGKEGLLPPEAAEDRAELFAIATEFFFERPWALRSQHPELFAALSEFYRLDPTSWMPASEHGESASREPAGQGRR